MAKIVLEIKKCWDGCPYCSSYNGMPKSLPNHFTCKKANKPIASYVEYPNEMPEVPDWCPITVMA